jgi:uncharacterized repeat protein (TIGR01451 family)
MNGNQMDTTCAEITTLTLLHITHLSLSSLEGIQYFDALQSLEANNNLLTYIPPLPESLIDINISVNQLSTLPSMPESLLYLRVSENHLTTLPSLPQSLIGLVCDDNYISTMPALPSGLKFILCGSDSLTSFASFSPSLRTLDCKDSPLLTSLPTLPDSLDWLVCKNCALTQLPALPDTLTILECGGNFLSSLPTLPSSLLTLDCSYNQITSLPSLPSKLSTLYTEHNQLTSMPNLPTFMTALYVNDNPDLHCLPRLDTIDYFHFERTGIDCLPNRGHILSSQPLISSIQLCDLFNTNNCEFYWNISGTCFQDLDTDCMPDSNETLLKNIKIDLFSSGTYIQSNLTNTFGSYSFENGYGTFDYSVDTTELPFNVICPLSFSYNSILSPIDSVVYDKNFSIECKPDFDLIAYSIAVTGPLFPNSTSTFHVSAGDYSSHFGLTCANNISGTVEIQMSGPVSYLGPTNNSLTPVINGNTLVYTITDFGIVNFNTDFNFLATTDSTAQSGDSICINVSIQPTTGDRNPGNNELRMCFVVTNSYDPNEKEVSPLGDILPSQEWLTYTLHFQNTGTASARNIYLIDTLSANLNTSSFTFLNSSHEVFTQLFGNVLRFNFPNINLPDSSSDSQNSHGYTQYKIKPLGGLSIGSSIRNSADIFFDFNSPIKTNTVVNTISNTISIHKISTNYQLSVIPNPVNDIVRIKFFLGKASDVKIVLINSLGQQVKLVSQHQYLEGETEITFSTSDLSEGVYYVSLSSAENHVVRKIIKI